MTRYTFADALPLSGSTAPLITAAVGLGYPVRLADLARRAEITKFSASRAAASLTELGLLQLDADGRYEFVDEHPMAATVRKLAWRLNGVTRPDPNRYDRMPPLPALEDDYSYRELIPHTLRKGTEPRSELMKQRGPSLVEVRDWLTDIAPMFAELARYWNVAQDVYSRWRTERLRDVVHQVGNFGAALSEATQTLRTVCGPEAQGDADPWQTCIAAHHWVRATYLVSAEAAWVQQVMRILLLAIEVGGKIHHHRAEAIFQLEYAADAQRENRDSRPAFEKATAAAVEAKRLWNTPVDGKAYRNIGGIPRPVDVGTAGDQILAVQLSVTLRRLTDVVADMAEHPSFACWTSIADEGELRPLTAPAEEPKGS